MNTIKIIIMVILLSSAAVAQEYSIDWYVIGCGGGHAESGTYQVDCTIGQPIVGQSSSANYGVSAGYWVGAGGIGPSGYEYVPGDCNMALGLWPPSVIGGDVSYLVGYFIGAGNAPCKLDDFWASADVTGDCNVIGGDVSALVGFFIGTPGAEIKWCGDNPEDALSYPPAWLEGVPDDPPLGWPNCDTPVLMKGIHVIPTGSTNR